MPGAISVTTQRVVVGDLVGDVEGDGRRAAAVDLEACRRRRPACRSARPSGSSGSRRVQRLQAVDRQLDRPVAVRVGRADAERRERSSAAPCIGTTRTTWIALGRAPGSRARSRRRSRPRRPRRRSGAPATGRAAPARERRRPRRFRPSGRRLGELARAARPAGRRRRASRARARSRARSSGLRPVEVDQLVEIGRHSSSPSRISARCISALRVRVFTVPSGIPSRVGDLALREVAPVGERDHLALPLRKPLERAVHLPLRPRLLGALVRADARATARRAPRPAARCGRGCGRRSRSARRRRATARPGPRSGLYVPAERQIETNVSCTASSARPRSPSRLSASPNTGRE